MHQSAVVIARDLDDGVSKDGGIPWHSPESIKTWRRIVTGYPVISQMTCSHPPPVIVTGDPATITTWITRHAPDCIVTCRIHGKYKCDTTVTDTDIKLDQYRRWATRVFPGCAWRVYVRAGVDRPFIPEHLRAWHTEHQYLEMCRKILDVGQNRDDRTGTGTRSVFGRQIEFDLANGFPLLTTKKTYWRGIVKELLWFLKGETDATLLSKQGVRIWDGNTSADALRRRGLDYPEGDAGPVYGFQWRHWGAPYRGANGGPYGGHDQLAALVRGLREDPTSRRHIVSAWNVSDLDKMALPPCHILFQCYVNNNRRTLDLHLYQRSVDVGLGLPFNIASYATLVHLISSVTGLVPGRLIISTGDAHIYKDHVDAIQTQIQRMPRHPPRLLIKNNTYTRLDQFSEEDIKLVDYDPHDPIRMAMSV
jgi:thymidylate synthase